MSEGELFHKVRSEVENETQAGKAKINYSAWKDQIEQKVIHGDRLSNEEADFWETVRESL